MGEVGFYFVSIKKYYSTISQTKKLKKPQCFVIPYRILAENIVFGGGGLMNMGGGAGRGGKQRGRTSAFEALCSHVTLHKQ